MGNILSHILNFFLSFLILCVGARWEHMSTGEEHLNPGAGVTACCAGNRTQVLCENNLSYNDATLQLPTPFHQMKPRVLTPVSHTACFILCYFKMSKDCHCPALVLSTLFSTLRWTALFPAWSHDPSVLVCSQDACLCLPAVQDRLWNECWCVFWTFKKKDTFPQAFSFGWGAWQRGQRRLYELDFRLPCPVGY